MLMGKNKKIFGLVLGILPLITPIIVSAELTTAQIITPIIVSAELTTAQIGATLVQKPLTKNTVSGTKATALGEENVTNGEKTVALGFGNEAKKRKAVAVGLKNKAEGEKSSAMGYKNITKGKMSSAVGEKNKATGDRSSAYGYRNESTGLHSQVFGYGNKAEGERTSIFGNKYKVTGEQSGAFGLGDGSFKEGKKDWDYKKMIEGSNSYAFGNRNGISKSAKNSFILGNDTDIEKENSVAIGNKNKVKNKNTFVLGNDITATKENSVYLGNKSSEADSTHSKALEDYSKDLTLFSSPINFTGGKAIGIVTIGSVGNERRLQNVAAGLIAEKSTDAINGSQLYAITQALKDKIDNITLKYEGDKGKKELKLKTETMKLSGDGNITTEVNSGSGEVKFKLNEVITLGTEDNKKIILNGKEGKGKFGKIELDGNKGVINKLTNITWNGTATTGQAATEDQLQQVQDTLNVKIEKNAREIKKITGGIATTMAMANIPQVGDNKLFSIGAGAAYYNKQGGFALGISGTEPSNTFIYKLSAGVDTQKTFGVSAGFNINFVDNTKKALVVNNNKAYVYDNKLAEKIARLEKENEAMKDRITALENKIGQSVSNFKEKLYIIDQFINNKYMPTKIQIEKLKAIVKEINERYTDRIIDITGHTDTTASERYNLELGLKRANKVSDLLISLGLKNPQNIRKVSSYGFNNKVNSNLSSNRRVEITVK